MRRGGRHAQEPGIQRRPGFGLSLWLHRTGGARGSNRAAKAEARTPKEARKHLTTDTSKSSK